MYPLGHFSLGYFAAKLTGKMANEGFNTPLIFFVSLLPDIDILIPTLEHRGPTHSIVVAIVLFLPVFIMFRRGLSYFTALASHSLIGDYFTAYGCKLFWPISSGWIRAPAPLMLHGVTEAYVELFLFLIMVGFVFSTRLQSYKRYRDKVPRTESIR